MEIMLTLYKDNTFWCFYGHAVCDFNDFNGIICWWFYFAYLVADAYFGVNVDYNLSIQFNTKRLSFVCFCLLAMLLFVSVEYFLTKQCWRSLGNIRPGPKGWNRISLFTYAKNWMVFFKSNFRIPPFSFDIDFKQHCFPIDKTLYSSGFCKKRYFGGWWKGHCLKIILQFDRSVNGSDAKAHSQKLVTRCTKCTQLIKLDLDKEQKKGKANEIDENPLLKKANPI